MLSIEEITQFIQEDATSSLKAQARQGQAYYEGEHDIKNYRLYYFNEDGEAVEDTTRSNIKIAHPFLTELVDQGTQFILSTKGAFIKSDKPELQEELDIYFNDNEDFTAELSEVLTDCQAKGSAFMFAYKNEDDRTSFQCADSLGVIQIDAKYTEEKKDHIIYHYIDRVDKEKKKIKRIQVWDEANVYCYMQEEDKDIVPDNCFNGKNVRPHTTYTMTGKKDTFFETFGQVPFWCLDNNKKKTSSLKPIKALIDDYDLMSCGLSNNLQDASEYLVVVSGFQGDNMEELIQNSRVKKHIGVDEGGNVDFKTVSIPYEARKVKLEHDEKCIYKFGMGLNTASLKDTSATTNIAIKAAYSLLDLRCSKLIIRLKQFLRKLLKVVLKEINEANKTDYQLKDVYFDFEPDIITNAEENARIKLTEAQARQTEINIVLSLAQKLDDETIIQLICEQLDIDYEEIKGKLPDPDEAENALNDAQTALNGVNAEVGGVIE